MTHKTSSTPSPEAFEADVRQICSQLYGINGASGPVMIDGRERDGVFDTGTELVIVEVTMQKTRAKIKNDYDKSSSALKDLRKSRRYQQHNFRILLVTFHEPTAEQRTVIESHRGCPIDIISYRSLLSKLLDGREYGRLRDTAPFGSIRNPTDPQKEVERSEYIPLNISNVDSNKEMTVTDIADELQSGTRMALIGDYGSGKSMTLRDVYYVCRDRYQVGETWKCPIYINLREHIAQSDPHEALLRHANKLGIRNTSSLVSAWRSGHLSIILDGFDELTPPQFSTSVTSLKAARQFAVELVRKFIEESPGSVGILTAGREHYFDRRAELLKAISPYCNIVCLLYTSPSPRDRG
jgi:hypothetical protein